MGQVTKGCIDLKGSIELVGDYFYYAINSILYQRSIYPQELFKISEKYGVRVVTVVDNELNAYLKQILDQIKSALRKLVLVISDIEKDEVIERWQFNVSNDDSSEEVKAKKTLDQIKAELRAVLKQVFCSVSLLPALNSTYSFNLLIYTDKNAEVPDGWKHSGPQFVANSQNIPLKSFATTIHRVDACISYKIDD